MVVMDFVIRYVMLPGVLILIVCFIPKAVKDVKQWITELFPANADKEKTAPVIADATVNHKNSFSIP